MKLLLVTFLAMVLFIPVTAQPQVSCFGYGSGMGSMLSCDGPRGNTTITPLSPGQGIIHGDRDGRSFLEEYSITPPPSSRRESFSSPSFRDDDSFSSRPIEPLRHLDRIDRLDRMDRLSDPLSDPLLPLLLGD